MPTTHLAAQVKPKSLVKTWWRRMVLTIQLMQGLGDKNPAESVMYVCTDGTY